MLDVNERKCDIIWVRVVGMKRSWNNVSMQSRARDRQAKSVNALYYGIKEELPIRMYILTN